MVDYEHWIEKMSKELNFWHLLVTSPLVALACPQTERQVAQLSPEY